MSDHVTIGALMDTIENLTVSNGEMKLELDDVDSLNRRLSDLLDRTANALHGGRLENGLWSFHDLPELATELKKVEAENDKLRGLLAKGQGDCVYCGLKDEDMGKCVSGFPGCARMDDIMAAQETEKDRKIAHLRLSLLNAKLQFEEIFDVLQ